MLDAVKLWLFLASVFLAFPKRSVLMAPTTILAKQLYNEARKYLPIHFKIALVLSKSKKENLEKYSFIIGTHALLFRDIPVFSLLLTDEQHRFGTKQRTALLKKTNSTTAHFLQFSATPIPRSQALINAFLVDASYIKETPFKKDITSKVIRKNNFKDLLNHIKEEIKQKRQVLIIYPLVEQSDAISYQSLQEAKNFWFDNFSNVYMTHGKDKQKEEVLESFAKNGDILLATTVVEVGISLDRLSSVVIVGAERLGLSTLHQLRGRVSRKGLKGHCFLYTKQKESKRLEDFCSCLNGFEIAELDLATRKSGDLTGGIKQSGDKFKYYEGELEIATIVKEHLSS